MGAIAFQIENRQNVNVEALMDHIKEYCEERDIEYKRFDGYRDDMVHYWWKVFKLKELMDENPDADYIMWFDSDIYIYDFNKDLRDYMTPELDFVAAHDPDDPKDNEDWFNAGVFCVRNSESGRNLIDKWMSLYDASKWSIGYDGKWQTNDRWAGPNYEQGSFCEQILQKRDFKHKIKILPSTTFNELFNWMDPGSECFSVHLMRGLAQKIGIQCMWVHRARAFMYIFILLALILFFLLIKKKI
jgi:galactosyl transferase GMA12/MNN10 family